MFCKTYAWVILYICLLLKGADQVTAICRESNDDSTGSINRQLSEVERLRKVIMELVDTEKAYVKVSFVSSLSWDNYLS
jgi:hypothetical protein